MFVCLKLRTAARPAACPDEMPARLQGDKDRELFARLQGDGSSARAGLERWPAVYH